MSQSLLAIDVVSGAAWVGGLAALSGAIAAAVALLYRWYARDVVPAGLAMLAGLAGVAISLNTTAALGQAIGDGSGLLDLDAAILNVVTFAVAAVVAAVGRRAGDALAREVVAASGAREVDADVGRLVRTVGRVTPVALPEAGDIEDIEGYEPVGAEIKEAMGGKTLLFPRRLAVAELRDRLATRLKDDYGVGHVGIELSADGGVEYLALGSRISGLGPTLPPGTGAAAVRADPPFAATSGDIVQVWADGGAERVATAELRGASGDVVTLALDAADAEALDPERRYRLVTLPAEPRPEQEFASLLRAADETMGITTIREGSPLVGASIDSVDATVIAVRPGDGAVEAIPDRGRPFEPGDLVYAIGRPEALRRLEADAAESAETERPS